MNNKVLNFGEIKNLREWLNQTLGDDKYLYRLKEDGTEEICYNIDLIWDGTNYHIAYTDITNTINYVQPFTYTDERVWSIK